MEACGCCWGHRGRKKWEGGQVAEPRQTQDLRGEGVRVPGGLGWGLANGCTAGHLAGPLGGTVTEHTGGPSVVREGRAGAVCRPPWGALVLNCTGCWW